MRWSRFLLSVVVLLSVVSLSIIYVGRRVAVEDSDEPVMGVCGALVHFDQLPGSTTFNSGDQMLSAGTLLLPYATATKQRDLTSSCGVRLLQLEKSTPASVEAASQTQTIERCAAECIALADDRCTGFEVQFTEGRDHIACHLRQYPMLALSKYHHRPGDAPLSTTFVRKRRSTIARSEGGTRPLSVSAWPSKHDSNNDDASLLDHRIVVGMMAAWIYRHERLIPAVSTAYCAATMLIYLEDHPDVRSQALSLYREHSDDPCWKGKTFEFAYEPASAEVRGARNGTWKNLALLRAMFRRYFIRNADSQQGWHVFDWLIIVDDDTYVFASNINFYINSVLRQTVDPVRHNVAFGTPYNDVSYPFLGGGHGILLSHAAVVVVNEFLRDCYRVCTMNGGDVRLSCCVRQAHVPVRLPLVEDMFLDVNTPSWKLSDAAAERAMSLFPLTCHPVRSAVSFSKLKALEERSHLHTRVACTSASPPLWCYTSEAAVGLVVYDTPHFTSTVKDSLETPR